MSSIRRLRYCCLVLPIVIAAGCQDTNLPQTQKVVLPDDLSLDAPRRSGPPQMANSTWALYEKRPTRKNPDRTVLLIRFEFGSRGEIIRAFDNNDLIPEHVGNELLSDGQLHPIPVPGATYVATSYGMSVGADVGFLALGRFFLGPIAAGEARAYAYGTMNDRGDRIDGFIRYEMTLNSELGVGLPDDFKAESKEKIVFAIRE